MYWLARSEEALPADLCWLSPTEAHRVAGLRHAKRRTEYLLRRLTAKHAVAAVLHRSPGRDELAHIEVGNAPSGRRTCGSMANRPGWSCRSATAPAGRSASSEPAR